MCVHVHVSMCAYVGACVCMRVYVGACVRMRMCVGACVRMRVCVWVHVCMCVNKTCEHPVHTYTCIPLESDAGSNLEGRPGGGSEEDINMLYT